MKNREAYAPMNVVASVVEKRFLNSCDEAYRGGGFTQLWGAIVRSE
jgi:hypothetical protein